MLLTGLLVPASAQACSGYVCQNSELMPDQQAPANLTGGYWFPRSASGADIEDDVEDRFGLYRVDGGEKVSVPVSIERVGDSPRFFWEPEDPLEPEARYRVIGPDYCTDDEPDSVTPHNFRATEEAGLPEELGGLEATNSKGELTVSTNSGACSIPIAADQMEISLNPTPEAKPWWDLFQFSTYVDGERWFYSRHLLGVGRSWVSGYTRHGRDLIYASCGERGYKGLAEGTHIVKIKATLPGSDREWVSDSLEVELSCDDVPPLSVHKESLADLEWLVLLIFSPLLLLLGAGVWWGARKLWNLLKG